MWKKWWGSWSNGTQDQTWMDNTTAPVTSTGLTYQQLQKSYAQVMQDQYAIQQSQQMNKSYTGKRTYPYCIDEDAILIDWARKRGDDFAAELYSKSFRAWSTTFPWSTNQGGPAQSLADAINQQSPFLKYLKGTR